MKKKVLMSWSSGKDSAWALHKLQSDPAFDCIGLFCTVNKKFDRVAMHGVRIELLKMQAERLGLPLRLIEIPYPCSNNDYESLMGECIQQAEQDGIDCFAFGDLFLEDIKNYRLDTLKNSRIEAIFPIWQIPTKQLAETMISSGIKAILTCVVPKQIPEQFAGRVFNQELLDELPLSVDPCGENGEFHSLVVDAPNFSYPIDIKLGKVIERDGFVFADVMAV
ncbi:MAG: hypothetical protein V2I33_14445 [Kangiellaceae bacterium]|jgi:uncharacterized protein (TIGR00290 family)|nr:hypothetical protein [Kangiellaceae bacterium]